MGFRRSARYFLHRLSRLHGTPYNLAAGFASGAAISFTPFVGLHFVLAAVLAWMLRANILASAIGTAIGNPWTFPFIWIWLYEFGTWLGIGGVPDELGPKFTNVFVNIFEAVLKADFMYVFETAWPIFGPMLVASIPTGIVVWFTVYYLLKPLVDAYQHRRLRARTKKAREKRNP